VDPGPFPQPLQVRQLHVGVAHAFAEDHLGISVEGRFDPGMVVHIEKVRGNTVPAQCIVEHRVAAAEETAHADHPVPGVAEGEDRQRDRRHSGRPGNGPGPAVNEGQHLF